MDLLKVISSLIRKDLAKIGQTLAVNIESPLSVFTRLKMLVYIWILIIDVITLFLYSDF